MGGTGRRLVSVQYSQHQRYPMVIEFYEKNSDCNERKE